MKQTSVHLDVEKFFEIFVIPNSTKREKPETIHIPESNIDVKVNKNLPRYITFFKKGCTCVTCGAVANKAVLCYDENDSKHGHFNFYGIKDGKEFLLTIDHIIPKALGGKNHIDNYQPMCLDCNNAKGTLVDAKLLKSHIDDGKLRTINYTKDIKIMLSNIRLESSHKLIRDWLDAIQCTYLFDNSNGMYLVIKPTTFQATYIKNNINDLKMFLSKLDTFVGNNKHRFPEKVKKRSKMEFIFNFFHNFNVLYGK